jgi:hypothetical protein
MFNKGYTFFQNIAGEDKPLPTSIKFSADSSSAISPVILHRFFCAS